MTSERRLKILLIIESCNPEWASVPLVGYNFYDQISSFADVTLVTHQRNEAALRRKHSDRDIVFMQPSKGEAKYYKAISRMSRIKGRVIWPLRHALQYPLYFTFDRAVKKMFQDQVDAGKYDIVHAMTPMMPRYPFSLAQGSRRTPTVIGPVNGGVPFPKAFRSVGLKEFSYFNFLRNIGSYVIPGYRKTYRSADLILAGSSYTMNWIKDQLGVPEKRLNLCFENGVSEQAFMSPAEKLLTKPKDGMLQLLFVGRLVPYKGCDMLLKALAKVAETDGRFFLTIVGDGSERQALADLVKQLGLTDKVKFTGWITQPETVEYYRQADVFCFPSVREFGGAVVMEAMACGLPCVVVDNGGIGEYVSETNGVKIAPLSADYVVNQLSECLIALLSDRKLLKQKSQQAFADARKFSWVEKGQELARLYAALLPAANSAPKAAKAPLILSTLGDAVDRELLEKPRVANVTPKKNK